jgi:tetratricopeptide (TPR) repeat protein/serine phosphatase RsbU (regulator of sigma subunit)
MIAIGGRYERQSPDSALKWYYMAYKTASNAGSNEQFMFYKASALYQLGWVECVYTGNFDNAMKYTNESLAIYETLASNSSKKNTKIIAKKGISSCYNSFGIVSQSRGEFDRAYEYYKKSLTIFEELDDKSGVSSCCNNIGNILMNQGKYDEAKTFFQKSQNLNEELGNKLGLAKSYINLGVLHTNQGNYNLSVENYSKALNLFEALGDKNGVSICCFNMGTIYDYQGIYDKALEQYMNALKISEEMGDKSGISYCYNNIGLLHSKHRNFDKALQYFEKMQVLTEELGDTYLLAGCFENLGVTYSDMGDFIKSNVYYENALKLREQLGDKKGIANTISNVGINYAKLGDNEKENPARRDSLYNAAVDLFQKSIQIRKDLDDKNGLAFIYGNVSELYISLANANPKLKNVYLNKSILYGLEAYNISVGIGAMPLQKDAAAHLQEAYKSLGKYEEALKYAEIYISTLDSIFSEEKTKSLTEIQTKYETEKKQQEIEKQFLIIEKQEIENKRQRNQRNFFIAGSFLLALLALVVFRSYQEKKRNNEIISLKNDMLEQANEEIAAQRDLVVEQKEHIEVIHEELTSSIRYASRIQGAVLPSTEQMNELLGNHFVLFRPKDIVSGDFYWATRVKEFLVFCVADCTGHGVPGAFMSMLGVSFLNEIVHKGNISSASEVLNCLRESIIEALKQKGEVSEQKDGMDIGLCVLNTQSLQMQFAGGYNPCWIVPNAKYSQQRVIDAITDEKATIDSDLIQIKPNKMPIAIHKHMEPFTNSVLQLYPGDQVYILSDGYQDQFGGPNIKKFMVKNLRELMVSNSQLPMAKQCEALENSFEEWKAGCEQVDDVTILGVCL